MKIKKIFILLLLMFFLWGCNNEEVPNNNFQNKIDIYYEEQIQNTIFIENQGILQEPTKPTKEGFIFDGWFVDYACTEYFDFQTPITSSLTLYGKFLKAYTITFENTNIPNQIVGEQKKINKPDTPIKEGYTFEGWYLNEACTNEYDFSTKVTNNLKIYAKWKEIEKIYFVTFNVDNEINTIEISQNKTISEPPKPTKDGYKFKGWYSDNEFTNKYNFDSPITSNITLYALFIKVYTITFETLYGTVEDIIVEENTKISKLPVPNYDGYIFEGWYINSTIFDIDSTITEDITLIAKWTKVNLDKEEINIIAGKGYNEGAFVEIEKIPGYANVDNYKVYYKSNYSSSYIELDSNLIRDYDTYIRADILGLAKGQYTIKVKVLSLEKNINNIVVTNYDRSGYAHFNTNNSVGAYNNDGTIKENANIIYVTEKTKNTVTAVFNGKTYTGIANILKYSYRSTTPVVIRIIGTIAAATWKPIEYKGSFVIKDSNGNIITNDLEEDEIISLGINELNITDSITKLNNLTNKITYGSGEYDSSFNMVAISTAKNVTLEGVGTDAKIFQWGIVWRKCNYIEIRNLTFEGYPEDACSFEAGDTGATSLTDFKTGHIWVHNNTFNSGKNYWDVTYEQDKHNGDGSIDIKGLAYVTISYNHFYKNHKTGLVGGSDSQKSACITFHHNFYDHCASRLPLGRQANMHMYNNYYYKTSSTNMSIRAGGYAFIENCVFENCNNPMTITEGSYGKGVIKSYNNEIINCTGKNQAIDVTSRVEKVANDNIYHQNFDIDSSVFYFDDVKQITKVKIMHDVTEVKEYVMANAGVIKR